MKFELRNVTRRFGERTAVNDVNLEIPQGQMVGIIGRSGAGKSTLLRMINRLTDPSSGSIHFGDLEVSRLRGNALRGWQRDCAMIFQQFNLVPRLDVLTNVLLGRLNHRSTVMSLLSVFTREERIMAIAALERLGIEQTALQRAGTLSGGQQQRVAIARALMQAPKMVLADEPIASLDPLNAKIVMDALRDINEREGITVITNLHTLDTARGYCERIIGMADGHVVFDGTPSELTAEAVQAIYGSDRDGAGIDESMTSTSINIPASAERPARSSAGVNALAAASV
ncbi:MULTISPECIES: phosphonate ABC transporter ATP-binding protein [Pseudorhizobium]|uniref:Phosphonate ABC transporter ATP-binding protein n=1 Tax=Pseudorhizobium pelagicum TaxID=1509405 RepID=A0A922T969_9HYPH|nr:MULTISPECIES: phosphonate ABC transporter ATP-binding protein [Pseudorhizobium]MBU1313636.1 phosphonate ABC transporter ATP-binding protein [Alphaproteobacteria bacterium]MDY6962971.1 phosphonate ABC transporter ATP-binding protein [Pseudomonadota bacterium]KEQ04313.1 phosphonate ABC transporter ATP-binding protein [Pseudorhizobium pelagicum]KEQ07321.1 phosphonate ABC transporter ATP-binding protein [Pseudorhizobium pelagicum]MBU1550227.1 phosphonate ABC transporter ATP-binding protein [Alp|tara:strand:- start:332 stop:1186 length:855 start_codon:yes stop_codon:yes gene_type:complete